MLSLEEGKAWVALVGKTGSWDVISGAGVRMNTGAKSWVWRQSQAPAAGIKAAGEGGGVCVRGMAAKAGSVSS